MKTLKFRFAFLTAVLNLCPAALWAADQYQIELSLKINTTRAIPYLNIYAKNSTSQTIDIVSEGFAPPWAIEKWFMLEADGREVHYPEHMRPVVGGKEYRKLLPGIEFLWEEILLQEFFHQTESRDQDVLKDKKSHTFKISPSSRWKDLKVRPAAIEIGAKSADGSSTVTTAIVAASSPTLTLEARQILERLNSWNMDAIDVCERPEAYPNLTGSGEARAFINDCKKRLVELGVNVKWNPEKKAYDVISHPAAAATTTTS
ncbi:MAG: hypothetical protein NTX50_00385 [Candidatus Sumerlaeota bacterium]|nr:hypothetical protein [Candidatus Sumerlaeota bacterium]